jgi:hypothetical protein
MLIVGCILGFICAQFMGTTRVSVLVACCLCWYRFVGFGLVLFGWNANISLPMYPIIILYLREIVSD